MNDRLTPQREAERIQGLLYEAITAFQKTAHLSSLQHAQMRGYLAEHLTPALLAELAAVRAERDQAREKGLREAADHFDRMADREPYQGYRAHVMRGAANDIRRFAAVTAPTAKES